MGEFREPCDWWSHKEITQDKHHNQVPKESSYCANKKSVWYLSEVCPRQICLDYTVNRNAA